MAYISMTHWNGIYTGFMTKGGTAKEHQRIDQELQQDLAIRALELIVEKIDSPAYQAWFDATWPGDSINATPWSEIYQTAKSYLELLEAGHDYPN